MDKPVSDELLEQLGDFFVNYQIGMRYHITFERFVSLVQDGIIEF